MSKTAASSLPSDRQERQRALDPVRSVLVQAPAGSGKTDLLARRFLRLLSTVEEPGQIVAITFTNAAAAEMRHRILGELEKAAADSAAHSSDRGAAEADEFSMEALALRALEHSEALGWRLLDLPAQLRVRTIDSFCRELALQQPLLSGFGGGLGIAEQPDDLYRRAARETLRKIDESGSRLAAAIEKLLLWRDNGWQEMEELLVEMLANRDRWMHDFVLEREPDWEALRERLERPFARAVRSALTELSELLDRAPDARQEALELARFACGQCGGLLHRELAEMAEFPCAPFDEAIDDARTASSCLANLLLTKDGGFRKRVDKSVGFPTDCKREKDRMLALLGLLAAVPGLESALADVRSLPPLRYSEEEWEIVRACFALLRQAAGELKIVFAEAGRVDYVEVAQIAQRVLRGEDGEPSDAAMAVADRIRHLLVDEFQDTSRRQHELLSRLTAAWPEREGRSCFVVGDPMQSIYGFREADAELFGRVRAAGLEAAPDEPLNFDFVALKANFRTEPKLVERVNQDFEKIFAVADGSGVAFNSAEPAREERADAGPPFTLHLKFVPQIGRGGSDEKAEAREEQTAELVELIRGYSGRVEQARTNGRKFRIAVLGRTRANLAPIAAGLREAGIHFRAVDLEKLAERPEVLDALAVARALFNPLDRVAWLGVLRAPWCGLSLEDVYTVAGGEELKARPVPELLAERLPLVSETGRPAAARVLEAMADAAALRQMQPTISLGTWLEAAWMRLGGAACVDSTALANLKLLWSCLDQLPGGEPDLLGPTLNAALDKLTAQPDAETSSECGVQLMTIHKSKGLEFEVVIVPELQAKGGRGKRKMLSWLERGLAEPDDTGETTEFLIAPFQRKGDDRGDAKAWVDRVILDRERQEDRRILYVAATRAREELHLFSRPACKQEDEGFTLIEPAGSLLATAWPALEDEVRAEFDRWRAAGGMATGPIEEEISSIAASVESNLLVMPSSARATLLRRLPADYQPEEAKKALRTGEEPGLTGIEGARAPLFARHEGGLLSRALGMAVHALLEELARLRSQLDWETARSALKSFEPRIAARVRAAGVDQQKASQIAAQALEFALNASHDRIGEWILSPHAGAGSEESWAGIVRGGLRAVRVDRVFRAGVAPVSAGEDCWWIVDYKTAHADEADEAKALPELHALFGPQVEAYGHLLRSLHGAGARVFAGLYYPRMMTLDWWEL